MTRFIYLHGFNSGYEPEHEKIKILEQIGSVDGITYNTYGSYNQIESYLTDRISYEVNLCMIGTSLGGYWAYRIAKKLGTPSVIINPYYDPFTLLKKYEGIMILNQHTNHSQSLSEGAIESYEGKHIDPKVDQPFINPLVLLDRGDSEIRCSEAEKVLEDYPMKIYQGGNHEFCHMKESLEDIRKYIHSSNDN